MNLTFTYSPFLLALCVSVAGAGAWWIYNRTTPEISLGRKLFLGSLRFVALALILFLLFEPLFERSRTETTPPVVAVLVDGSESMSLADSLADGSAPTSRAILEDLQERTRDLDTRTFVFGSDTAPADSLSSVTFDQSRTDISSALESVRSALSEEPLGAVVLFSDGLHNSGTNPIHEAERYPVPIIAIAHGDSTSQRDLRIVQVVTNELAYSGTTVPVRVRVRNDGFPGSRITVTLRDENGTLFQQPVQLSADGSEASVELEFKADEPGLRTLEVVIDQLQGEATYRNNREVISVQVLDQKKSVLLVAGAPSPDVSAITRSLRADENVELVTAIQMGPGTWFDDGLPADLTEFDLVVLVGFPGEATSPSDSRRLAEAVSANLPVLFMLDRSTDLRALQNDWAGILPATPENVRDGLLTGSFVPAPAAASHVIFDVENRRDASLWRRLPPVTLSDSRWTVAPGATVLAQPEVRGVTLDDPLFVVGRRGTSRTAAILGSGFWRWTNVPTDLEQESAHWAAAWENMIQWLYTSDDDRLVRVRPTETTVAEGEPVIMRGEVYDESLNPVSDAALTLNLRTPAGETFPYEMQSMGSGRYSLDLGSLPSGTYSYSATAARNEADIGTDEGSFRIGERTLEYRSTRSDYGLLNQLSGRSGGVMLASSELGRLSQILQNLETFVPRSDVVRSETRLWQRYPFLIVILLLVSIEWFFRKRYGMV